MPEYHVGCGIAGIYAGILKSQDEWKSASLVTDEAVSAVAQYLLDNNLSLKFTKDGVRYRLCIRRAEDES